MGAGVSLPAIRVTARVSGDDVHGYRVTVRSSDEQVWERSLTASTCDAVTNAAALLIALAVEPLAETLESPEPVAPEPEGATTTDPPSPPSTDSTEPITGFVTVGIHLERGLLPDPGLGGQLGLGVSRAPFSAELFATLYVPQSATVHETNGGGRFKLLGAGVRLCHRILPGAAELFACGSGALALLHARGFGISMPSAAATELGIVGFGPRVDLALTPTHHLTLGIEGTYALGTARFVIEDLGLVHEVRRIGAAGRIQFVWHL